MSHPPSTVTSVNVNYDAHKFAEMLLHVAGWLRGDMAGGATKLNKVLFFAEFTHLRRHSSVISGCEFQKLEHGPAPRQLRPVRTRLIADRDAELVADDYFGRRQHRLVPLHDANLDRFTKSELAVIDEVLQQLDGMTAVQVSDLSHLEPGWRLTEIGETIPYSTAFLGDPQVHTPTSRRLSEATADRYGFTPTR